MTDDEKRLEPLDRTNLAVNWPLWKEQFLLYLVSKNKLKESESTKIAIMLLHIGQRGKEIYHTLFPNDGTINGMLGIAVETKPESTAGTSAAADAKKDAKVEQAVTTKSRTLDEVLDAFEKFSTPKKNVSMESYKFNMIEQKEKQSFTDFETELRTQLRYYAFQCACGQSYGDRMLRDRIIVGVNDKKLQLKLLDGRDEPVAKVIEVCKVFEAANTNKGILEKRITVNAIANADDIEEEIEAGVNAIVKSCFNCGFKPYTPAHLRRCKANGQICGTCNKKGHFQQFCKQKGKQQSQPFGKRQPNAKESLARTRATTTTGKRTHSQAGMTNTVIVIA